MKRLLLLILFIPLISFGDDPFACVDQEFRQAFLPGHPVAYEYSTDLPAGFPGHVAPANSRLVGSQLGDTHVSVAYVVDGDIEAAMDEVTASMSENGWIDVGEAFGGPRGGFQATEIPKYRQLCHDDGPQVLTISAREGGLSPLISISSNSRIGLRSCEELANRSRYAYRHMGLQQELPVLKLPDDVRSTNQGSGGGGDEYETRVSVSTDMGRQSLVTLLNDQIRDQGWSFDSAWSGSRSTGSAWIKQSEQGDSLVGMLHAYGENSGSFSLLFSIRLDNSTASGGRGPTAIRF